MRSWPPRSARPACWRSGSGSPVTSTTPSARGSRAWCCCWRPPRSPSSGRPVDRHIAQALRSARDNLAESRQVVWALRPRPLTERSLPEALEELAGRLAEETGLRADTTVTGTERPLGAEAETTLLRIAQEALANVRKHATAAQVTVTLSFLDDVVLLDVADDGAGFDTGAAAGVGGLGLRAMRERITRLGGGLTVESTPGEGTTIAAELPTRVSR